MTTLLSPEVANYLNRFLIQEDPLCKELEQSAQDRFIPIMDPDTASLVRVLALMQQPKSILEVGTAIGYSTYVMATSTSARIVTIEIDEGRYQEAVNLFSRAGISDRVLPLCGDALTLLQRLDELVNPIWQPEGTSMRQFDWILLDAAKGQYPRFLELLLPRLREGGLLLSDNVLFQGLVSGPEHVKHKLRTLVNRLREYNQLLATHPDLQTAFVPVGDGLTLSVRRCRK